MERDRADQSCFRFFMHVFDLILNDVPTLFDQHLNSVVMGFNICFYPEENFTTFKSENFIKFDPHK